MVTASKGATGRRASAPARSGDARAAPWTDIADFPTPTMDNAVAYGDGKVYSVAGFDGTGNVADGYVYDPTTQAWTRDRGRARRRSRPRPGRTSAGKVYVIGGWDGAGNASSGV